MRRTRAVALAAIGMAVTVACGEAGPSTTAAPMATTAMTFEEVDEALGGFDSDTDGERPTGTESGPSTTRMSGNIGPAEGVNALVAPGRDLVFEATTLEEERSAKFSAEVLAIVAVAPQGWRFHQGTRGLVWNPPDGQHPWSIFTDFRMKSACQGTCEPQDWKTAVMDTDDSPFARPWSDEAVVLVDRELEAPSGRTVVVRDDRDTVVITARWDDRVGRFFWCEAELARDDGDYYEAFAAACEASVPLWFE